MPARNANQALVAEQGAGQKSKRGAAGSSATSFGTKDPDAIDDDEREGGEEQGDKGDELEAEKVNRFSGKAAAKSQELKRLPPQSKRPNTLLKWVQLDLAIRFLT